MQTMKELQFDASKPHPLNLTFPSMDLKELEDMKTILRRLSNGKAIAWDGVTDSIFKKDWQEKNATIFSDLWKNLGLIKNKHFESRLIPLNKVHPQIPSRKDMRPIVVTSPIVKLIEAGLLPELSEYLIKNLHHGQTGFVPGFGIFVNIHRAIERIKLRTLDKRRCYGVFVDFSSAYNTIDHQILFQRLQPILGEEKTQLIRALYSRMKIRLGNEVLLPKQGVTQGSLISPALFDIYEESLLQTIENETKISEEDILAYADDIMVICDSVDQVRRVIQVIREWSGQNNMKLNKKKSGVVEFIGRRMRTSIRIDKISGFPVCKEYKYLGLKLNCKLSMNSHLDYISNKSKDIHRRLSPFLYQADLDTRKNLWQVFIQPLLEFALPLYKWETAISNVKRANSVFRSTFKLFTGLSRRSENTLVDLLSGYDFNLRASLNYKIYSEKWICRKNGTVLNYEDIPISFRKALHPDKRNLCKFMPKEFIHYLNLTKSSCPTCETPSTFDHLECRHHLKLPNANELLRLCQKVQDGKAPRKESLELMREIINPYLRRLRHFLARENNSTSWIK